MGKHEISNELATTLERALVEKHGPLMANDDLRAALGYPTMEAFRQALSRKTVPIPVFSLEKRHGKFALAKDVAKWLAMQREAASKSDSNGGTMN
jgi:hypothetical protein